MKKIITSVLLLASIVACDKEVTVEPEKRMRVIDITPATYSFLQGGWNYCDHKDNSVFFKGDTLTLSFPGHSTSYFYTLIRNVNINMIHIKNISDTSYQDYLPFEIKENNEFWLQSEKCCR